jgi:hypothetical protein
MPTEITNVMIDPSLLSSPGELSATLQKMREHNGRFQFYISQKFIEHLHAIPENSDVLQFFEEKLAAGFNPVSIIRDNWKLYRPFEPTPEMAARHNDFKRALEALGKEKNYSQDLVEVIFQEWVFMLEMSFLTAAKRKIFETFRDAGAGLLEVSKEAFKEAVGEERGKEPGKLTSTDYLIAIGKWTGKYGSKVAKHALPPPLGLALEVAIHGIILIVDP